MRYSNYLFTLDVHKTLSQVSIPVTLGDTARRLFIDLTDGGKPYTIPDGCRATLSARKADGNCLLHDCIIEKNTTIRYDFTEQTATAPGKVNCQILLYGETGKLIASPRFTMVVYADTVGYDVLSETDLQSIGRMLAAEQQRVAAENARVKAEQGRVAADIARDERLDEALNDLGNRVAIDYAKNYQMDLANTNLFAWNLARQTVPMFGGEITVDTAAGFEGYRINKVGVKANAAGNVRFILCEVQENVLKHIADIGVAAVDGETLIAELSFDEGAKPFVQNEHTVILACADGAIIQGIPSNDAGGLAVSDLVAFDDADYYGSEDGTEITYYRSTTDIAGVIGATLFDIDHIDHFALREFMTDTRTRLDDIEESIPDVSVFDSGKYVGVQSGKYALLPFPKVENGENGADGITPHIGANGNWFIGETDTGIYAAGAKVDATLKTEGAAADAAVCGAKFTDVYAKLADLMYEAIAIVSFANDIGSVEIGQTVNIVTLNWTLNKTPAQQTVNGTEQQVDTRKYAVPAYITSDTTYTLRVTDERGAVAEKSTTVSFLNGIYYGALYAQDSYTGSAIHALDNKKLAKSKAGTFNITAKDKQYAFFCYPKRMGAATFVVGGFTGGFELVATVSFKNDSGYTEDYYIYKSEQAGLGSIKLEVS